MRLKELVKKIRSKNAGPFLLTIDIFCSNKKNFETIIQNLTKIAISKLYKIPKNQINIFPMKQLNIIKITIPRPNIQGSSRGRDLHGASYGIILEELKIKNALIKK